MWLQSGSQDTRLIAMTLLFASVLTVARKNPHLHTLSCSLFLNCRGKNACCYTGHYVKCVLDYCNCLKKDMLTRLSCLSHTDTNIRSPQSQAAARLFHMGRRQRILSNMCQMSLGSQPAPLPCQWTLPPRPTPWTHTHTPTVQGHEKLPRHNSVHLSTVCYNYIGTFISTIHCKKFSKEYHINIHFLTVQYDIFKVGETTLILQANRSNQRSSYEVHNCATF
jgi:hypothetical protein